MLLILITGELSKVNHEMLIVIAIEQETDFVQQEVTILALVYLNEELIKPAVKQGSKIIIY